MQTPASADLYCFNYRHVFPSDITAIAISSVVKINIITKRSRHCYDSSYHTSLQRDLQRQNTSRPIAAPITFMPNAITRPKAFSSTVTFHSYSSNTYHQSSLNKTQTCPRYNPRLKVSYRSIDLD